MVVLFEGADATGKSTLAASVAAATGGVLWESPVPPLSELKSAVLDGASPATRLLFFLASNSQVSDHYRAEKPSPLLLVRHTWSTIAYHAALEAVPAAQVAEDVLPLVDTCLIPDHLVFLTTSRARQLERLRARGESGLQARLGQSEQFQRRLNEAYACALAALPPVSLHRYDTTHASIDDATSHLVATIWPGTASTLSTR